MNKVVFFAVTLFVFMGHFHVEGKKDSFYIIIIYYERHFKIDQDNFWSISNINPFSFYHEIFLQFDLYTVKHAKATIFQFQFKQRFFVFL